MLRCAWLGDLSRSSWWVRVASGVPLGGQHGHNPFQLPTSKPPTAAYSHQKASFFSSPPYLEIRNPSIFEPTARIESRIQRTTTYPSKRNSQRNGAHDAADLFFAPNADHLLSLRVIPDDLTKQHSSAKLQHCKRVC